jgi:L-asparaginase/Glu-tRNA(Gln) amidotransferase subunit D
MSEEPSSPNQGEPSRYLDIGFLTATPVLGSNLALTEHMFKAFEDTGSKAIVITGFATGTTPSALNPFIAQTVERGVPVFILSDNSADIGGPDRIVYGVQEEAVQAGATPLKDINVNNRDELAEAIQDAIDKGKAGAELRQVIVDLYGTPTRDAG